MEQANRTQAHFERILLVSGLRNAGKSTALRRMFTDPRFGTKSIVPKQRRLVPVMLSRERCLFIRVSSPHETRIRGRKETLDDFIGKLQHETERAWQSCWRFNFACAVQPHATPKMAGLVEICERLCSEFMPERIRVVQIDPRQDGAAGALLAPSEVDSLRALGVEVMTIDARRPADSTKPLNGLLLADFFDFT